MTLCRNCYCLSLKGFYICVLGLFRSMSTNSGSNSDLILSQEDSNVTSQPVLSSKGEGNATERKQLSDTARWAVVLAYRSEITSFVKLLSWVLRNITFPRSEWLFSSAANTTIHRKRSAPVNMVTWRMTWTSLIKIKSYPSHWLWSWQHKHTYLLSFYQVSWPFFKILVEL